MGKVYLPLNAPWIADLMHEMTTFPAGAHDDQVDALGLIGRMLDTMVGGRVPPPTAKEPDRFARAFQRRQAPPSSFKTM